MRCDFCGHEFDLRDGRQGCGTCPGGCKSVHCPRCNYAIPLEPELVGKIRTFLRDIKSRLQG